MENVRSKQDTEKNINAELTAKISNIYVKLKK